MSESLKTQTDLTSVDREVTDGDILEDVKPIKSEKGNMVLALPRTHVIPGTSVRITVHPQWIFRPLHFFIPEAITSSFEITDIRIGHNSQLWSPTPVPASVFSDNPKSPVGLSMQLKFDVCQIAMDINVTVRNLSPMTVEFVGTFIGKGLL